jgi:uncharacterized protein (DUF934 family)
MPTLIKLEDGAFVAAENLFTSVSDEDPIPTDGGLILSLARFQTYGAALLDDGRPVGVRIEPAERVEDLAYDLPRLALVAPAFPKFRDGRAYSTAALLRERLGFRGEVRAVGDVLREQAYEMVRCGFTAFEPADGSTPEQWAKATRVFRHVYQAAADERPAAFVERLSPPVPPGLGFAEPEDKLRGGGGAAQRAVTEGARPGATKADAPSTAFGGPPPPLRRGG